MIYLFFLLVPYFVIGNCKVAICYFGLTRSVTKVYQSHHKNIFHILEENSVDYDIYMHTWSLKGKQRVNTNAIDRKIDYDEYQLLHPNYYKIEDQEKFTNHLDFRNYFDQKLWLEVGDDPEYGEWPPLLILNHLCALESQKRVTEMVIENGSHYDFILYLRPDVEFHKALDIASILALKHQEIAIPDFDHGEGYNDRFAALTYQTAPLYGMRINQIAEFRKNHGRIVSEKYVKYICEQNNFNVRLLNFYFSIIRPT